MPIGSLAASLAGLLLTSCWFVDGACGREAAPETGWVVETTSAAGRPARGRLPSAAFVLAPGEVLLPEQAPGAWRATFTTDVVLPDEGRVRFGLEAEGCRAVLEAGGPVADRVEGAGLGRWMAHDGEEPIRLVVTVESDGAGPARVRALWAMAVTRDGGFALEPIPTRATRLPLDPGERLELEAPFRGRLLLEQKGCTGCHDPGAARRAVGIRRAPALDGVADRIGAGWMGSWLRRPDLVRPGADMPALFGAGDEAAHADVAAFLAAGEAAVTGPAAEAGRDVYHRRGCVACHGALEPEAALHGLPARASEVPGVDVPAPFGLLAGKWNAEALAAFLLDPEATHPDGRMPDLDLSEEEAAALAGYLVSRFDPGLDRAAIARGREAFAAFRCGACHARSDVPPPAPAPTLADLDPAADGCLHPEEGHGPARYDLSTREREDLRSGLAAARAARSGGPAPLDATRRALRRMGCLACHAVGGEGGVPAALRPYFVSEGEETDLGDEGRLPPDLSSAGFRLATDWMHAVLVEGERARPWIAARMPHYGEAHVDWLADGLSRLAGVEPGSDARWPEADDDLVLIGRELAGTSGMSCIGCHVFGDHPPTGTVGPDLTTLAARLRYEWYAGYLQDPQRRKPGTRMPAFGAGGRSTLPGVLGGDLSAQGDALWAYFALGESMPVPDGVVPDGDLALSVGERPVVLRTFLPAAGSRGIAVGFPVGRHLAYDAEAARLVEVWRGAFLDASGAWANRGGQVAEGQGPTLWTAPAGPPLVLDGIEAPLRFAGYRLDALGVPTFLARLGDVAVSERVEPHVAPVERIVRRFALRDVPAGARVHVARGPAGRVLDVQGGRPEADGEGRTTLVADGEGPLAFTVEIRP